MNFSRGVLLATTHLGIWAASLAAQGAVAEVKLTRSPLVEVGRAEIELHRVTAAAVSASGALVIADAGNHRVLVISPRGELVRHFGREGSGPGEFRTVTQLWVVGDTVITNDATLSRITIWRLDGTVIGTLAVPAYQERPVFPLAALSAWRFVGRIPPSPTGRAGLHRDTSTVVLVDWQTGAVRPIADVHWSYTYLYTHDNKATTGYRTPFLGETYLATLGGHIAIVPRGTADLEVRLPNGALLATVRAPVNRRPLTRAIVNAYRDSMTAAARPSAARFPGNLERISDAFGSRFQIPAGEYAPVVRSVATVGHAVWLQALTSSGSSTADWFIIHAEARQISGRVVLPVDWMVLGGTDRSVIVLRRDEFDVQYVQVYGTDG